MVRVSDGSSYRKSTVDRFRPRSDKVPEHRALGLGTEKNIVQFSFSLFTLGYSIHILYRNIGIK